jgi:hypothetical protein
MYRKLFAGALVCTLFFAAPASAMSNNVISEIEAALAFDEAVVCDVSRVANVALVVEKAVNQGKTTTLVREGTTTTVQAASSAICRNLGGVVKVSATAP